MTRPAYSSMRDLLQLERRDFLKAGTVVGAGLALGTPEVWAQQEAKKEQPTHPETNIADATAVPWTEHSLPGRFPGRVVQLHDAGALVDDKPAAEVIAAMFATGLQELTGRDQAASHALFFTPDDVIGIKVNPVGAGLIATRLELVDAIITWLTANGTPRENIIIWDRFASMLTEAGFTSERYPGVGIEALQILDETAMETVDGDDSGWLDADGNHLSLGNFDQDVYYWADVDGPKDKPYLNQHVVNGKHSYFGKLLTRKLTKIINVPVLKNTGNGISVATKNLGYAAICNTGRLHKPLFFDVCTEVLAFPAIRDKLVLNITDGLRAQYDGGPMPNASFAYVYNNLLFATDPFALDMVCHGLLVQKRKEMKVKVNEHPRYTEYLRYAQRLGLGVVDPEKIEHIVL